MMLRARARALKWTIFFLLLAGGVAFYVVRRNSAEPPVVFRTGKVDRGPVSLQGHDPTTDLSFRNIRITELAKEQKK